MNTNAYHIEKLVYLNKRQQEAADFVAHCSPTGAGRDLALAHLRHVFGTALVSLNEATGAIVVGNLFTATPITQPSLFAKVATVHPFA